MKVLEAIISPIRWLKHSGAPVAEVISTQLPILRAEEIYLTPVQDPKTVHPPLPPIWNCARAAADHAGKPLLQGL